MNYNNLYIKIINNSIDKKRSREDNIYYEKHHILPKCMGGKNNEDNLVLLTAKEHFISHLLLCRIYTTENKLWYALNLMSNNKKYKDNFISARLYSEIKEKIDFSKINKGRVRSQETKLKISEAKKGQIPWNKGIKYKGESKSQETKDKISQTLKGHIISLETRLKISKKLKNDIYPKCPLCIEDLYVKKYGMFGRKIKKQRYKCNKCNKIFH